MHGTENAKQLYILLSFHKYGVLLKMMGWNSEVNTVTHYRLDSPGIKHIHADWPQGATQAPVQWVLGLLPTGEEARAWH